MGIAIIHYKDPHEPTSIIRCHDGFVAVAEVALEQETDRLIFEALIANICIEIAWPSTYLTAYCNRVGGRLYTWLLREIAGPIKGLLTTALP